MSESKEFIKDFLKNVSWVIGETEDVNSHYDINEQIGLPGTYGTAYRAIHQETKEERAVKVMCKDHWSKEELTAVRKEVKVLKTATHPNIIKVFEIFESASSLYIVTELCEGGELFDLMTKKKRFSEVQAALVVDQLLSGLGHLHSRNIAHCDLKPDNVLLLRKDSLANLKIIDMGMAQVVKPDKWLSEVIGTPYYVAPEVLKQRYNLKCDLFAVGVILFMLLFGYPPFDADDLNGDLIGKQREDGYSFPSDISVSDEVKDLIRKLLRTDPSTRLDVQQAKAHPWLVEQSKEAGSAADLTTGADNPPKAKRKNSVDRPQSSRSRPGSRVGKSKSKASRKATKKTAEDKPKKGLIGLKMDDREDGQSGTVVTEVMTGMSAETAGLCVGDVVQRVNGAVVRDVETFRAICRDSLKRGNTLAFTVEREKQPMRFTLTVPA